MEHTTYQIYSGNLLNNQNVLQLWISTYDNAPRTSINYIGKDLVQKFEQILIDSKDNKLENDTIVYFNPYLTEYPRYKYKNYVEENKLNIIKARKPDKINAAIIGVDLIKQALFSKSLTRHYILPKDFLFSLTKSINSPENFKAANYIINEKSLKEIKTRYPAIYAQIIEFPSFEAVDIIRECWGNQKIKHIHEAFTTLVKNQEKYKFKIIFDTTLNHTVNQGLNIDEEVFTTILNMSKSKDNDNISLAKELIANCELENSKPYILFLLWSMPKLQKYDSNKNYEYCLKALKPYFASYAEGKPFQQFIAEIIKMHPEYMSILFNCFRIYLNSINEREIISEIKVS